jgi:hypothetical protein
MRDHDIDGFLSTARVTGTDEAVKLEGESFREFLYALDDAELARWRGMSYEEFTAARQGNEFLQQLLDHWDSLYAEPFVGITADGAVETGLYTLPADGTGDAATADAATAVLASLTDDERSRATHELDAPAWRGWSNPEFVFHKIGVRLEDISDESADAVHALVRASLSETGYSRVREAMELNAYLGELVDLPTIMNARSYWFALFGTPTADEPWGWQLFGHHVAVNWVSVGGREVVAPVFIGAEPALSDGAHTPIFDAREQSALRLAASLTSLQREAAVVFASVLDPAMPEGRLHPADERHVAGAFRDNRVVPYEGIRATELDDSQRALLRDIADDFHGLLRDEQRLTAMAEFDTHIDQTWFSWYGATDGTEPIYFRVHSPVILAELDNHAGVWLSNRLPARFHVHSTLRHPNGNDYGKALIAQWRATR